jgi:hypothetical protein
MPEFQCHTISPSNHSLVLRGRAPKLLPSACKPVAPARAERVLVNMLEAKMFVEFRVNTREDLEAWLKAEGMHFDFLVRIEWEMRDDQLQIAE